jgi:hypothetical protein
MKDRVTMCMRISFLFIEHDISEAIDKLEMAFKYFGVAVASIDRMS